MKFWLQHITLAVFLLLSTGLQGQGWERLLSGGGQDQAFALANTPDGGYVMTGYYSAFNLYLSKTDSDGRLQWFKSHSYAPGAVTVGNALTVTPEGDYILAGSVRLGGPNGQSDFYLAKTDAAGVVLWEKVFGQTNLEVLRSVKLLDDGRITVSGYQKQANGFDKVYVALLDAAGDLIWQNVFGTDNMDEKGFAHIITTSNEIVITGEQENGPDRDVFVVKTDMMGGQIWQNTLGFDLVPASPASDAAYGLVEATNGNIVLAGLTTSVQGQLGGLLIEIPSDSAASPNWYKAFPKMLFYSIANDKTGGYYLSGYKEVSNTFEDLQLVRTDASGEKLWETHIGKGGPDYGFGVICAPDGGVVSAGSSTPTIFNNASSVYLVKADDQGRIFTNSIQGNVYHDLNINCEKDAGEPGLKEWIVRLESPDLLRFATTDANGNYNILVDTGAYEVRIYANNNLWESCADTFLLSLDMPFDTAHADFPIQVATACPRNEVSVNVPFLRRCAENTYTVRYCNNGTVASTNTLITVSLDTFLTLTNSSKPIASQNGSTYTFLLGFVEKGFCGSFTFDAWLNCDSTETGQTHCVEAHIFPDDLCEVSAGWDGSDIQAEAVCENGLVKMKLRNKGVGNMNGTQDYVIIEDVLMLTEQPQPYALQAGQDTTVFSVPANGKTYRIIAEQSPDYPGLSMPTAAVEGCTTDTSSTDISLGYFTMFPQDDANPFIAYECQESNLPDFNLANFKRGYPKGYDVDRYVSSETDLQYLIQFSNTGTDTVRQVIIIDTLSAWLDPTTVRPGAGSHPFSFELYGDGILRLAIPNLSLIPNSSASSEAQSTGFVSFRVSQKPDLECGTQILNSAAIHFDFQAPTITGQTLHTVCDFDEFIVIQTKEIHQIGLDIKVYPNPFVESATFEVLGGSLSGQYGLELFDAQGKKTFMSFNNNPTFRLFQKDIPVGFYFYRLTDSDGRPVASGTLIHK